MSQITVLVVRRPDAANAYIISAPTGVKVQIITADFGAAFDGSPLTIAEAHDALEIAASLKEAGRALASADPVRTAIDELVSELQDGAAACGLRGTDPSGARP